MHPWEREYRNPQLVTEDTEPIAAIRTCLRTLKKLGFIFDRAQVIDLGTGTGRHAIAFAKRGAAVTGIDVSPTAIQTAKIRSRALQPAPTFLVGSIGTVWPINDQSVDLILDVTSSNALTDRERIVYRQEIDRTLAPGGFLFVRTLCKDGDTHARALLKSAPGPEQDTYRLPGTKIVERVFSKTDLLALYAPLQPLSLKKVSGYTLMNGRRYKRQYWIALFQRPKT